MLVLLVTAFLPIMGIQFAWVTIHWVAGLVLTATIVYHIIHAMFWQDFWAMVGQQSRHQGRNDRVESYGRKKRD